MCTAITLESFSKKSFLARTMDFSHNIIPQFYITPACHTWVGCLNRPPIQDTYRFIGLGQEADGILAFFDGVNEKGFAAAALYFPGYAQYEPYSIHNPDRPVAAFDFVHYILGQCASIKDLTTVLEDIYITGVSDPVTNTVAPLHWIAADRSGSCAIIEPIAEGIQVTENSIGVLSNSPPFDWHMTNLRNYMETTPKQMEEAFWKNTRLTPFGQAGGTVPLPGGFTSPERFVRTAYIKTHLPTPVTTQETVAACFHTLENVSVPRGSVTTVRNTDDFTKYIAVIDLDACQYFYRTYNDMQVQTASLEPLPEEPVC